jgi:hypothetical protein
MGLFSEITTLYSRGVKEFLVVVLFELDIVKCINGLCGQIMKTYYDS